MTNYEKLVAALRDIEKTMFALGTSPINMDNVSIRLAYDKRWGQTANDAADAIEALQAQLPKLGEWVELGYQPNVHETRYRCSLCGRQVLILSGSGELLKTYPYCHCGAKMEVQDG
jgi:DNA-directed RNA polymerase subunit RPC12/RpoP